MENNRIPVFAAREEDEQLARELAARLDSRLILQEEDIAGLPLWLRYDEKGLSLTDGVMTVRADLARTARRMRQSNLHKELLVRAAKVRGGSGQDSGQTGEGTAPGEKTQPLAIDATAGLGDDALLLAAAGFSVRLYEADPVIAALLGDGLRRAALETDLPLLTQAVSRMTLFAEDSIAAMRSLPCRPDVILLDPMFPERKKSASIGKKFQILQQLEKPCGDEEELLAAAIAACPRKIVIKRPRKGPHLAGIKPDYTLEGSAIRYDCILPAGR